MPDWKCYWFTEMHFVLIWLKKYGGQVENSLILLFNDLHKDKYKNLIIFSTD